MLQRTNLFGTPEFPSVVGGFRVAQYLAFCVMFYRSFFIMQWKRKLKDTQYNGQMKKDKIRASDNSSTCTFTTGKSVTCTGACANEIIPSINRSLVDKAKEGRHVRIFNNMTIQVVNNDLLDFNVKSRTLLSIPQCNCIL